MHSCARLLVTPLALLAVGSALDAQRAAVGGHAIGVVTHATPVIAGRSLTEAYLTQPMLSATLASAAGSLRVHGVLNLEGLTLQRGELNAGVWGEGYVDRRHPHTYLHELVVVGERSLATTRVSFAAGRGFVPFGTDDPMVRHFVKYPANHHLAQILERWVVIGAASRGAVAVEAALLNGDEPVGPRDIGRASRFGDSWSARVTVRPTQAFELQASTAALTSPEIAGGGGVDQRKRSASGRWHGIVARDVHGYALFEWARTRERYNGRNGFAFGTLLGEASLGHGAWAAALRLERTERPEEERGFDPFRTPRPHAGPLLGITAWTIASAQVGRAAAGTFGAAPFVEVARVHAREIADGIFDPVAFYGSAVAWSVSAGVRVHAGRRHERMGRYGAASPPHGSGAHHMASRGTGAVDHHERH